MVISQDVKRFFRKLKKLEGLLSRQSYTLKKQIQAEEGHLGFLNKHLTSLKSSVKIMRKARERSFQNSRASSVATNGRKTARSSFTHKPPKSRNQPQGAQRPEVSIHQASSNDSRNYFHSFRQIRSYKVVRNTPRISMSREVEHSVLTSKRIDPAYFRTNGSANQRKLSTRTAESPNFGDLKNRIMKASLRIKSKRKASGRILDRDSITRDQMERSGKIFSKFSP